MYIFVGVYLMKPLQMEGFQTNLLMGPWCTAGARSEGAAVPKSAAACTRPSCHAKHQSALGTASGGGAMPAGLQYFRHCTR